MTDWDPTQFDLSQDGVFHLLNSLPVPVLILDDQYRIEFINEAFSEFVDSSVQELPGQEFANLLPERSADEIADFFKQIDQASDQNSQVLQFNLRKTGSNVQDWTFTAHHGSNAGGSKYFGIGQEVLDSAQQKPSGPGKNQQFGDNERLDDGADQHDREDLKREPNDQQFQKNSQHSPVALCLQDLSSCKEVLDQFNPFDGLTLSSYLKQNKEKFHKAVTNINVRSVNRALLDLLEAEDEDELLQTFDQVYMEETYELLFEQLEAFYSGDTSFQGETTILTLQGKEQPVFYQVDLLSGQDDWSRAVVSYINMTDRVFRPNRQLEAVFDTSLSYMAMLAPNGDIRKVNKAAQEQTSRKDGDLRGEKFWNGSWWGGNKSIEQQVKNQFQQCLEEDESVFQTPFFSPDGKGYVEVSFQKVMGPDDRVLYVLAEGRDLSGLRESQRRFKTLYEQSPVGLAEEDMSSCKSVLESMDYTEEQSLEAYLQNNESALRRVIDEIDILSVNDTLLELVEAEDEEQLFGGLNKVFTDSTFEIMPTQFAQLLEGKRSFEGETTIRTLEGNPKRVLYRVDVVDEEDDWSRVFVSWDDITDLHETMNKLDAQNQELQATEKQLRAEIEQRKKKQERLNLAQEATSMGIWEWDIESGKLHWDEYMVELFEFEAASYEEFLYSVHTNDREQLIETIQTSLETGEPFNAQFRVELPTNDELIWVEARGLVQCDDGKPGTIVASCIDITEEKRLRESLERREEQFRQMAETIDEVHWLLDADASELLYINSASKDLFGIEPDELMNSPEIFYEQVHDDDLSTIGRSINQAREGSMVEYQFRYHREDEIAHIQTRLHPIKDESGSVKRLAGVNRDVTKRERLQEQLRQQRDLFKEVINTSPNLMYVKDAQGKFILVNETAAEFLGGTVEEVTGSPQEEIFESEVLETIQEEDQTVREAGEPLSIGEERLISPNTGEEHIFQTTKFPLDTNKPVDQRRVLGVSVDVTREKKIQDQLQQSVKEKETLLKEVHHRVKNNMQVITSLLKLQARQIDDEKTKHSIKETQSRVRSMALIHEKLYQSENLSALDLGAYIEDLINELIQAHSTAAITPQATINIESGIELDIDRTIPVGLIINELVVNSIEHGFTPDMENPTIAINARVQGSNLELTVSDNGVGLPENFDPEEIQSLGFQLLNSLAVDQLRGEYEFTEQQGTKVTLEFPYD